MFIGHLDIIACVPISTIVTHNRTPRINFPSGEPIREIRVIIRFPVWVDHVIKVSLYFVKIFVLVFMWLLWWGVIVGIGVCMYKCIQGSCDQDYHWLSWARISCGEDCLTAVYTNINLVIKVLIVFCKFSCTCGCCHSEDCLLELECVCKYTRTWIMWSTYSFSFVNFFAFVSGRHHGDCLLAVECSCV